MTMSKIYTAADQLIGKTPLLELTHIEKQYGLKARLLGKLEYLNPTGSVKDRIAKAMLDDAEEKGLLREGSVIIEPTQRQYRHWAGIRCGRARLSHYHRHAGNHVGGAPAADDGLRCRAGADRGRQGHEGGHCQGG